MEASGVTPIGSPARSAPEDTGTCRVNPRVFCLATGNPGGLGPLNALAEPFAICRDAARAGEHRD